MSDKKVDLRNLAWHLEWIINARSNGLLDPPIRSVHDLVSDGIDERDELVVCGSGPSLDNDLDKLTCNPAVIVANHSNLATLLYFNVRPDYVLITDAGSATYERLARDVLPHFDTSFIRFILPTHTSPKLVELLRAYSIEPYFFVNLATSIAQTEEQNRYNDILQAMTPSLSYLDANGNSMVPAMVQCGCVSNASLIFAVFLALNGQPLKRVYLSGVDFSFPNGFNRCTTVRYEDDRCIVEKNPPRHPNDPPLMKLAGLDTDIVQFAYYNDLKFIASNLASMSPKLFDIYTTSQNFIADFLEVRGL